MLMIFLLLVAENSDVSAASEMAHIISWSESNKLKINLAKCRELVFKRPNLKHKIFLCTLPNVVRVNSVKLLGVYLDHTLCFHEHVEQTARNCNQRFYLLQQLRKQGVSDECSKVLFYSIVLSKILYALSACSGYISMDNVGHLNIVQYSKILCKAKQYGFTDSLLTFSELLEQSDKQLFSRVVCTNHCLFHLLGKDNSQLHMSL